MLLPPKFTQIVPLVPGQNATVYKAYNSYVNRDAFIKIYPIPENDPQSALREPRLLQMLEHPNVAKIYGADAISNNRILLEMELVRGGSFKDLLDSAILTGRWSSVHEIIKLTLDAASGIGYLHLNGYVHRDIKPANLVIGNPGPTPRGIVTDLGLISRLDSTQRAFASKQSRLYRPPEAWANLGYSVASDIYQLGMVLFQMLGGFVDYGLSNLPDDDLRNLTISGELINLGTLGPHIEDPLRKFLQLCICPESARIQTMADFVVELNKALLKQSDWIFTTVKDGFTMEKPHGKGGRYLVTTNVSGKNHTVTRSKRTRDGEFRKIGEPAVFSHKDLGTCRSFKRFINLKD